ncbi:hypothetical protein GGR57DRAFT_485096 [Xylariaceae sp. FL1272]|nr:hypothetical protein GGR57DRAFT_485096 [Xylariaceae sp. FL1272]
MSSTSSTSAQPKPSADHSDWDYSEWASSGWDDAYDVDDVTTSTTDVASSTNDGASSTNQLPPTGEDTTSVCENGWTFTMSYDRIRCLKLEGKELQQALYTIQQENAQLGISTQDSLKSAADCLHNYPPLMALHHGTTKPVRHSHHPAPTVKEATAPITPTEEAVAPTAPAAKPAVTNPARKSAPTTPTKQMNPAAHVFRPTSPPTAPPTPSRAPSPPVSGLTYGEADVLLASDSDNLSEAERLKQNIAFFCGEKRKISSDLDEFRRQAKAQGLKTLKDSIWAN